MMNRLFVNVGRLLIGLSLILGTNYALTNEVRAQVKKKVVSVSFREKSLASILDFISAQTEYSVTYDNDVKSYPKTLTVSFDNAAPLKAIQEILNGSPFTYKVEGKKVTVYKLQTASTAAQTGKSITGVVQEANGSPLPYVTIQLKGTKSGCRTGLDGDFKLEVNANQGEIIVTSVGFEPQTVKYTVGKPIKIVMKESVNTLGEVSVIAYGERNTREIVGSMSSIKGERIQDMPTPSVETLLQGQMSGVEVTNLSGSPGGGGTSIVIRGHSSLNQKGINNGSPLFVIDGVPVKTDSSEETAGINPLASLDPSTIESVEVLKDAASAILYGSRAGNGVVLVTTKKGKAGKSEFNVSVSQSFTWLPRTPLQVIGKRERDFRIKQAKKQVIANYDWGTESSIIPKNHKDSYGWDPNYGGSYDYLWRNGNLLDEDRRLPTLVQDSLNTFYNNRTNWYDYAFRVGKVVKADLTATGGTENVRYMISTGVYDESGIMINSKFSRVSFMSNLDINLTPKLKGFANVNLAYMSKAGGDQGRAQGLTIDPKQTPSLLPGKGSIAEEIAVQQLRDIEEKNSNYNVRLNLGLQYNVIKGLTLSSSAAVNHYLTRSNRFTPNYLNFNNLTSSQGRVYGMTSIQNENIFNYTKNIGDTHNFDFTGGVTFNRDAIESITGMAYGGPGNNIHYIGDAWPQIRIDAAGNHEALQKVTTNFEEQIMMSYLGRFSYNYKKKYLADLSLRSDGSSVFGSKVRWGMFPAVALGWAFSYEPFMRDFWWLSFGKLRASWGRSGQKFQEAYLAHGIMQENNSFFGELGLQPSIIANNKLTWEKSDQYDFGLDLDLLNYRLKLKLDYYYKYSSALLMQIPLPGDVYLLSEKWDNSSAISNEGVELELHADILRDKAFNWSVDFNISRNWNMFRKSYGNIDLDDKVLGRPIYGIYTYKDEGIVQREEEIPYYYDQRGYRRPLYIGGEQYPLRVGGRKIKDQNSDGRIDLQDRYYAGSTIPLAYGGFTNTFSWKGFRLNMLFNYSLSRKVMNMVKSSAFNFNKSFGTLMDDPERYKFWEKPGDNADYPSLEFSDNGYRGQFDGDIASNIENVSFLRLKQLILSYTIPETYTKKLGMKTLRVYLSGENLFLLTNYSGIDPEIIDPHTGKDTGDSYPLNRKFTVGLNIKF